MRREQLEHIIRAAAAITNERDLIVVGSQAILAAVPNAPVLAPELCMSRELDLYPARNPALADLISGAIGEGSDFDATFGYYADGVAPETAVLPKDWQKRLIEIENANTGGGRALCAEPHDIAISKLIAHRPKDLQFVDALLKRGIVQRDVLQDRLGETAVSAELRAKLDSWLAAREPR